MRSEDGGVMKGLLSVFADRLRAKAATRRKRDLKRAGEKKKTHEEMTSRDWQGNLLTSISFPSQDSGTLTDVMAVLCEWNGTRGVPTDLHAKQSVRSGSGSGGCGRFVKSKSYERSVASRSRSVNKESPQLVSMNRRTLENSPT
jgi:hypothetical protein